MTILDLIVLFATAINFTIRLTFAKQKAAYRAAYTIAQDQYYNPRFPRLGKIYYHR